MTSFLYVQFIGLYHELSYDVIPLCTVHWALSWVVVWRDSFMCSSLACKGVLHDLQLCHELIAVWRQSFMHSSLACKGVLHDLHVYRELMYGYPSVPALLIAVAVEFTRQTAYSPHSQHRFPAPSFEGCRKLVLGVCLHSWITSWLRCRSVLITHRQRLAPRSTDAVPNMW